LRHDFNEPAPLLILRNLEGEPVEELDKVEVVKVMEGVEIDVVDEEERWLKLISPTLTTIVDSSGESALLDEMVEVGVELSVEVVATVVGDVDVPRVALIEVLEAWAGLVVLFIPVFVALSAVVLIHSGFPWGKVGTSSGFPLPGGINSNWFKAKSPM
jgi:hypothetical protein